MNNESGNPALSEGILNKLKEAEATDKATISGTTMKIFVFLAITVVGGYFGWQALAGGATSFLSIAIVSLVAFVFAMLATFKPTMAGIFGSVYALAQGFVLGAISQYFNASFEGIVVQAVGLTGAIFFASLWFFALGLIKVTDKFRTGVFIATAGIAFYYLIAFVLGLFNITAPLIFDTGPIGIAVSVFIIFIATLNLILDFDMIQGLEKQGAPKTLEWYGAFALIVTLLWLYVEVLRLLAKTRQ